eukprot:9823666-Karenia_brevis.AAC.1
MNDCRVKYGPASSSSGPAALGSPPSAKGPQHEASWHPDLVPASLVCMHPDLLPGARPRCVDFWAVYLHVLLAVGRVGVARLDSPSRIW